MEVERLNINKIHSDPSNVRTHDEKNIRAIMASLQRFGQQKPIVLDQNGIVRAGNGTLEAAKKLEWDSIEVVRSHLTDNEMTAYAIADNRTAELAAWDDDGLSKQLAGLDDELRDIAYEDYELPEEPIEPSEKDDAVPDTDQNEFEVKLGDVWILGNHRLMCGDSTDKACVDKLMNGAKADMVFTEPPYGIEEKGDMSARGGLLQRNKLKDFKDDSIDYVIKAFQICDDLKIPRQVWWGANYYCHSLPLSNNWFVWDKRVEEKQKDTQSDCELAWIKSKWSSVRIFRSERGEKRVHPTQKPIALAIWSFDYFKDVKSVLDLFLGLGSTLIACEKTNRTCYGMELGPHYCSVIIKRWQDFTGKEAHRGD